MRLFSLKVLGRAGWSSTEDRFDCFCLLEEKSDFWFHFQWWMWSCDFCLHSFRNETVSSKYKETRSDTDTTARCCCHSVAMWTLRLRRKSWSYRFPFANRNPLIIAAGCCRLWSVPLGTVYQFTNNNAHVTRKLAAQTDVRTEGKRCVI